MSITAEISGPFRFRRPDLEASRLNDGVRHTLAHFSRWRDTNPGRVAEHVEQYCEQVAALAADRPRWTGRRAAARARIARETVHFGVLNMAEVIPPATVAAIVAGGPGRPVTPRDLIIDIDGRGGGAAVTRALERHLPGLRGRPETGWLTGRLDRLHHALPETVVRAGSMGKVVRAMAGVLAIAAYDTLRADPAEAADRLARVLPGAYAFGAAYAIVDDTLHDLPRHLLGDADRRRYGRLLARALATGEPPDPADVPDHPLAEELADLHATLLEAYPFDAYRHLYHAAESMYLAQDRDAARRVETHGDAGLAAMYPDILIKAGMSRVIANILAGRELDDGFYARCVNTVLVSQLRDDLIDRVDDGRGDRLTPFTFPAERADTNPLYDLFAYNAYVAGELFGGDPVATDALTAYGAGRLATHLSADPGRAEHLLRSYPVTGEIARFLRAASGLSPRAARRAAAADQRLRRRAARILDRRQPTAVDCRTFVADRLGYLDDVIARHCPTVAAGELGEIVAYAMGSPGKRLRPALTLMLAEGLDVAPASIEPVLAASELFHTASLLFDDLPAQDNATVRRGRPAAHVVFDEGGVQLAALSMISSGFGLLATLAGPFPAQKVAEVIAYVGTVLGPDRLCRGQLLDLRMGDLGAAGATDGPDGPDGPAILRMYELKTSTAIEAALVPLAMVLDRPREEITLLERYARHAGIVFQLRDDILDATSSTEVLGKDADNDVSKVNVVRHYGLAEADRLMQTHLAAAVDACERLPFDTRLLAGMARHFATRRR
jgi:geranylgeranyl pyrophosphate synthase